MEIIRPLETIRPLVVNHFSTGDDIMEDSMDSGVAGERVSSDVEALSFSGEIHLSEVQRRRRNVMELDKSICRTRLSQRRLLIRMQADSTKEMVNDPVRFYRGSRHAAESGRVVDWD